MMKNDDPVVIRRVGNGYQVEPFLYEANEIISARDIFVFQAKSRAKVDGGNSPGLSTLFDWLDAHFTTKADD